MGHDKKKSAAPPPGPGPLPYLKKLVHPCVRLPYKLMLSDRYRNLATYNCTAIYIGNMTVIYDRLKLSKLKNN